MTEQSADPVRSGKLRISPRAAYQILDGLAVVVATRARMVHRLDEVGSDLWKFLEPGRRFEEVLAFLLEEYEVEEGRAREDLGRFLGSLRDLGLVEVES